MRRRSRRSSFGGSVESPATFGLLVAFSAGLLSFLSPCVLPLVPSYVTFITGLSLDEVRTARRTALVHALLFVLGFSLIFIALGATASVLGRVLFVARVWIARIGGALIIVFGLYLLGVFNVRLLGRDSSASTSPTSRSATSARCWWASRSARDGRRASDRSSARSSSIPRAPRISTADCGCSPRIRRGSRFHSSSPRSRSTAFSRRSRAIAVR